MELITDNECWFGIISPIWDDDDYEEEFLFIEIPKKVKPITIRRKQ